MTARTLIAAFGNELRGDDGFGVAVLRRLAEEAPPAAELLEVGTGGVRLAQELLRGYERLIVIDAMTRGQAPGTLYVDAVERVEPTTEIDLHAAVPSRALALAQALGALPPHVLIVGCEPLDVDELTTELSPAVQAGVERAVHRIRCLLEDGRP